MAIIISESGYPKYPIVNHASYPKLRGIFVEIFCDLSQILVYVCVFVLQ